MSGSHSFGRVLLSFSVGDVLPCYSFIAEPGRGNMTCFVLGERLCGGLFSVSRLIPVHGDGLGLLHDQRVAFVSLSGLGRQAGRSQSWGSLLAGGLVLGVCLQAFQFAAIGLGRRPVSGATAGFRGRTAAWGTGRSHEISRGNKRRRSAERNFADTAGAWRPGCVEAAPSDDEASE